MNRKHRENQIRRNLGAAFAVALGLALWWSPLGEVLARLSFDLPMALLHKTAPDDVLIVYMDDAAHEALDQQWGRMWDRGLHAQLVERLKGDQARLVVFDVVLADAGPPEGDARLANALQAHGAVVLAATREPLRQPGLVGETTRYPRAEFRAAATNWGLARVELDSDLAVRRHYRGTSDEASLSWAAAALAGANVAQSPGQRLAGERWFHYYGPGGVIPELSYHLALRKPPGYFRDKIVFIGGKPGTRFTRDEVDEYATPFTRWDGSYTSGVEILATEFLNLLRGDWLRRLPASAELLLLIGVGVIFGSLLAHLRPVASCAAATVGILSALGMALVLFAGFHLWFSWLPMAVGQIPCALVWNILRRRTGAPSAAAQPEESILPAPRAKSDAAQHPAPAGAAGPLENTAGGTPTVAGGTPACLPGSPAGYGVAPPPVAGHTLLRCIGRGAYGEVWLARDVIGGFHAVKIIRRSSFGTDAPFEREFRGMQKFTPISRSHPGFVHVLHVDREEGTGCFYYIMEVGDDETSGQKIDPLNYVPKNLARELARRRRIPVEECVQLSLSLAAALDCLHRQQLIHRDIKPSNIIFVNGTPKLADIGLVTDLGRGGRDATYVGTEGYMAPEGPGTAAADVYSLGKVIYEAAMGRSHTHFPELPTTLVERAGGMGALLDLNEIILKACALDPTERYQSAAELQGDLLRLQQSLAARPGETQPSTPAQPNLEMNHGKIP